MRMMWPLVWVLCAWVCPQCTLAVEGAGFETPLYEQLPFTSRVDTPGTGFEFLWDFDPPPPTDPLLGWEIRNLAIDPSPHATRITSDIWTTLHGNPNNAPIPEGDGALWIGAHEDEVAGECWPGGVGYGNNWKQRWQSPTFSYLGGNPVGIGFDYFQDSEQGVDRTRVWVRFADGSEITLNGGGFSGQIGNPTFSNYTNASYSIPEVAFGPNQTFTVLIEFDSDESASDEDGLFMTSHGAFAFDNFSVTGPVVGAPLIHTYELGHDGWTAAAVPGPAGQMFVRSVVDYVIADPCLCDISGNVLALHTPAQQHPSGEHFQVSSPIVDRATLGPSYRKISGEWEMYADLPRANGVFFRPGWSYYPAYCGVTGAPSWSDRVGRAAWYYLGDEPDCFHMEDTGTDVGVPGNCDEVRLVFELWSSCSAFGIVETECTGVTNFTPVFDNVIVRVETAPDAPAVSFLEGHQFQDGYPSDGSMNPLSPANADVSFDLNRNRALPADLDDVLQVRGPEPYNGSEYEVWLHVRVRREGPEQAASVPYQNWLNQVSDGSPGSIVGSTASFAAGRMAEVPSPREPRQWLFASEFHSSDDSYVGAGLPNNEIVPDGVLLPGTQIEYFVTSNYAASPAITFRLPPQGPNENLEFEILPGYRDVAGNLFSPCLLSINAGDERDDYHQHALNMIYYNAAPNDPLPVTLDWDRFDRLEATSNWIAPLFREPGGDNGISRHPLFALRAILYHTGNSDRVALRENELLHIQDWLTRVDANSQIQGVWLNGDNIGMSLGLAGGALGEQIFGATPKCNTYNQANCGPVPTDDNYCVRVDVAAGAAYPPPLAYDIAGDWCPTTWKSLDVLNTGNGGVGHRVYVDYVGGPPVSTNYASVTNSVTGSGSSNYRSIVDGWSWNWLTTRDVSLECVDDYEQDVQAQAAELTSGLEWIVDAVPGVACPGTAVLQEGSISGRVWRDDNLDCDQDAGEIDEPFHLVSIDGQQWTTTDADGNYSFGLAAAGNYTVAVKPKNGFVFSCPPLGTASVHINEGEAVSGIDFGHRREPYGVDLYVLLHNTPAVRGIAFEFFVHCGNLGAVPSSAQVVLSLPTLFEFRSAEDNGVYDPQLHQVTWTFSSLDESDDEGFTVEVHVPSSVLAGTTFAATATISPISGDLDPVNNVATINDVVRAAVDPNSKRAAPFGGIDAGERIQYRVDFQNEGNASAFDIVVRDQLDADLDLATLELGTGSHAHTVSLQGREIAWTFAGIMLPDKHANEPASHGFVEFSIAAAGGLTPGTEILNQAAIYFDFEDPILTNFTVNVVQGAAGLSDADAIPTHFSLDRPVPNPTSATTSLRLGVPAQGRARVTVYDVGGRLVRRILDRGVARGWVEATWDRTSFDGRRVPAGIYFVHASLTPVVGEEKTEERRIVVLR